MWLISRAGTHSSRPISALGLLLPRRLASSSAKQEQPGKQCSEATERPSMNHSHPQNPPTGGAFLPMDPSMLPAAPFPNLQMPFPPGLNLFPPPPPPQQNQDHNMAPHNQGSKNKKKKRKNKGKNANAPNMPPKAKGSAQLQSSRSVGNGVSPVEAQSQFAPPPPQMFGAQSSFYGQNSPHGPLPHEQQFMGHLQALIHSHQNFQPPTAPADAPAPSAPVLGPSGGRGPTDQPPPTGPKAKSKPPKGPKAKSNQQPKRAAPSPKRDAKRAPSLASGGVPYASHTYLATSSLLPFPSPQPRPLLVIIDLNGTLVHRPSRRSNPTSFQPRPHASPFLHYVITTFTTMIWSSAKPENVHSMTDRLLDPADRASLLALWGREAFGFTEKDYNDRVQCYKRLSRVWQDPAVRGSHPMGQVWDQTNTVLIDDSAEKARSEPHNLIEIPEFLGEEGLEEDILPQVHTYLNTLSMQGDVSRYIRAHPFRPQDKPMMN